MKRPRLDRTGIIAGVGLALAALVLLAGCTYRSMQRLTLQTDHLLNKVKAPPEVANYVRDLVWASPGGEDLLLDVSWPEGPGPFPMDEPYRGGTNQFHWPGKESGPPCTGLSIATTW